MEYVKLGDSDLMVSKVCLGCMGFGEAQKGMHSWTLPYEESKKIIKYALDNYCVNYYSSSNSGSYLYPTSVYTKLGL